MNAAIEVAAVRKRFGPGAGAGRDEFCCQTGPGDRIHRAQWCGEVDHDAGDPRSGRAGGGPGAGRRAALPQPGALERPLTLYRFKNAASNLDLTLWGPGVRPDPLPCSAR